MSDITNDIPARVAVLEEIARGTRETIADMRAEMRQGFTDLRAEMRQGFADIRGEFGDLRAETRQGFADIRGELTATRTENHTDLADLRRESRSDYRWLLGLMLGGFAALLTVVAHGFKWI